MILTTLFPVEDIVCGGEEEVGRDQEGSTIYFNFRVILHGAGEGSDRAVRELF